MLLLLRCWFGVDLLIASLKLGKFVMLQNELSMKVSNSLSVEVSAVCIISLNSAVLDIFLVKIVMDALSDCFVDNWVSMGRLNVASALHRFIEKSFNKYPSLPWNNSDFYFLGCHVNIWAALLSVYEFLSVTKPYFPYGATFCRQTLQFY